MACRQVFEHAEHGGADLLRALLQLVLFDHVQHGAAGGAAYRVGTVGVKIEFLRHRLGDFTLDDQRRQRESVADALGGDDDIGDDVVMLKRPEMIAGARHAGLYFVDDQQTAGCPDALLRAADVTVGQRNDAAVTLHRLDEHAGELAAGAVMDSALEIAQVRLDAFAVNAAILVRHRRELDAAEQRHVVAKAADAGDRLRAEGSAVVGIGQR